MSLCAWIVLGFLAGLLARALMPGDQKMGFIRTTLLGIVGSFVGGFLAALFRGGDVLVVHPTGFIGATLGALVVLAIGAWFFRSK